MARQARRHAVLRAHAPEQRIVMKPETDPEPRGAQRFEQDVAWFDAMNAVDDIEALRRLALDAFEGKRDGAKRQNRFMRQRLRARIRRRPQPLPAA